MVNSLKSTQWENILASLDEGVVLVDRHGCLALLNPAAEDLLRTSHSQAVGQSLAKQFRHDAWIIDLVKKTQKSGHAHSRAEGDLSVTGGKALPVSVTASPYVDASGRIEGTVLVMHDLTRRRQLEEDLMHSERLAMIGTFTAGLLHEIRNPLAGIKGAAQLLAKERSKDAAVPTDHVAVILGEVERLNDLLAQLLRFSHPPRLSISSLNIHKLLDEVLLLERETMRRQEVTLQKEFDPSLPMIDGDASGLKQVFLNMVKNSLEAMPSGGALKIRTKMETDFHLAGKQKEKFIRVDIEDNGHGIPPQDLKQIFAPFFTTKSSGSGLGLAISHRIVSQHGGTIHVESAYGAGTAVQVTLKVERGGEDG